MKALDNLSKSVKRFTDKNSPVILIEKSNNFSIPFFVVGALVGAIAALIFTPDTGENNRKKIAEKFGVNGEDEIKFKGRQSYKIREMTEDGVKDLEKAKENMTQL